MIIDCISDLHGHYPKLEGGDLLIVSGDLTARDEPNELWEFCQWMIKQDYKRKILISGNHDNIFYENYKKNESPFVPFEYLCDSGTEFEGLKIWGSPWTKTFKGMNPRCKAFTVDTEDELMDKWDLIPVDVDILITHTPPYGILDGIPNEKEETLRHVGSKSLYNSLKYIFRPYLHMFGHIHEGYGIVQESFACRNHKYMKSVNASHVNARYKPVNKPIRVVL